MTADEAVRPRRTAGLEAAQWRQLGLITVGAAGIFVGLRLLPTGTNLSHMDFRVDPKAGAAIEFCDPLNPQFIPVLSARSPVTMSITTQEPARAGQAVQARIRLATGSGRAVAPEDLLVAHTRKLHLLLIDPSLRDYQHVHPEPAKAPGEWAFSFTPARGGTYRVFGDFMPAATGRGLYASVDLAVAGAGAAPDDWGATPLPQWVGRESLKFGLAAGGALRAGQPIALQFSVQRVDDGVVALEPVMGAFAHLVAFDLARTGFAHLHPLETDLTARPDPKRPRLNFKLTIPRAGPYVVWAQVNVAGRETFVPFPIAVGE